VGASLFLAFAKINFKAVQIALRYTALKFKSEELLGPLQPTIEAFQEIYV